jgi:cytochrome c5
MRMHGAFFIIIAAAATPLAAQEQAFEPDGPQIFQLVCSMCHTVNPPPQAAPPMSHVAGHYRQKHQDDEVAVAAMVEYIKHPEAERSALPAHAIERFGLMPAQIQLTDGQLKKVARYVLSLADTTHMMGASPPQSH